MALSWWAGAPGGVLGKMFCSRWSAISERAERRSSQTSVPGGPAPPSIGQSHETHSRVFPRLGIQNDKNKMTRSPCSGNRVINLATTYSRGTYRPTTIGCTGLNGRVRDGNGWNPRHMVTRKWHSVRRVRDGENERSLQYSMQGGKLNARNFERFPTRPEGRWGCINRQGH